MTSTVTLRYPQGYFPALDRVLGVRGAHHPARAPKPATADSYVRRAWDFATREEALYFRGRLCTSLLERQAVGSVVTLHTYGGQPSEQALI